MKYEQESTAGGMLVGETLVASRYRGRRYLSGGRKMSRGRYFRELAAELVFSALDVWVFLIYLNTFRL